LLFLFIRFLLLLNVLPSPPLLVGIRRALEDQLGSTAHLRRTGIHPEAANKPRREELVRM